MSKTEQLLEKNEEIKQTADEELKAKIAEREALCELFFGSPQNGLEQMLFEDSDSFRSRIEKGDGK